MIHGGLFWYAYNDHPALGPAGWWWHGSQRHLLEPAWALCLAGLAAPEPRRPVFGAVERLPQLSDRGFARLSAQMERAVAGGLLTEGIRRRIVAARTDTALLLQARRALGTYRMPEEGDRVLVNDGKPFALPPGLHDGDEVRLCDFSGSVTWRVCRIPDDGERFDVRVELIHQTDEARIRPGERYEGQLPWRAGDVAAVVSDRWGFSQDNLASGSRVVLLEEAAGMWRVRTEAGVVRMAYTAYLARV